MERDNLGEVSIVYRSGGLEQRADFIVTDTDPWLILARPQLGIEYHFDISLYDELFSPGHANDKAILDAEQQLLSQ